MKIKKQRGFQMLLILGIFFIVLFGGISKVQTEGEKKAITFTVVKQEKIPKELKEVIGKNKASPFHIVYTDQGKVYIAEGYGTKSKTGYDVEVGWLYEMEETIHIKTRLKGPEKGTKIKKNKTYPYIVVEIKDVGKKVFFD